MSIEFCTNCTKTFAPGEARYEVGNDIVCAECAQILSHVADAPRVRRDQALSAAAARSRGRPMRRKHASSMPLIVTLVVTMICSSLVLWLFWSGKLSLTKEARPENPNVARFNDLIDKANDAAAKGKDDVAIDSMEKALRILDDDADLQSNTDRAALVAQLDKLMVRSGRAKKRP